MPLSLHALVAERLQQCSDDERTLLRNASVFGRDFDVAQVGEIFGGEGATRRAMLEHLSELQLLDAVDATAGKYRFRHALTRDAIYSEMPPELVRPLHLRIAEHLEASPGSATSAPETLAHHFWQADRHERAAQYYERAGDSAMTVFAYDDAAVFYQRAAEGFAGDSRRAGSRVGEGGARAGLCRRSRRRP